jgi:hypothetical protein
MTGVTLRMNRSNGETEEEGRAERRRIEGPSLSSVLPSSPFLSDFMGYRFSCSFFLPALALSSFHRLADVFIL